MHIYAGLSGRVLVGDGEGWTERLTGASVRCVAADSAAPERAFAGTVDAGLQRTTDGGATWSESLATDDRVTSVTVDPGDPDLVWAGTEPSAVYRSTDGGKTWTECGGLTDLESSSRWSFPPRPDTHHVRWITVAPDDPEQLYVAIEAGALIRSPDGGETWVDHPDGAPRDSHTFATHPAVPDRVYSAAGDGYARSEDRGATWTYPEEGLAHGYVWSVAVHPDDPDRVVVTAASGAHVAHSTSGTNYVYRWTGERWTLAMDGLPGPDGLARPDLTTDDEAFYALSNHGLFRSARGETWTAVGEWDDAYDQLPQGLAVV